MRVLFIGGTGVLSSACSRLALEQGFELYVLNRGQTTVRPLPAGARLLCCDINDRASVERALGSLRFDCVCNFIAFAPDQVERDVALFTQRTQQYIFISSASVYKKPVSHWPITESTPAHNPFWQYSQDKIACEVQLQNAWQQQGFPATIVRPSHTYDATLLPFDPYLGGGTVLERMRRGKPVVVHGDGTSLWTLTHHRDFAQGLLGIVGNPKAVGETFHITSDELLSWNEIYELVARAAGVEPRLVHVPSHIIARHHPAWGAGLLGDKAHSVWFDNSKIRRFVPDYRPRIPFAHGVREIIDFYDRHPEYQPVDPKLDALMDQLTEQFR